MTRRLIAGTVAASLAAAALMVGYGHGTAYAVKPACDNPPPPSGVIQNEPWQQAWFDAPAKIWPFSTGAGTTVAVIDAGVDGASQPQLAGKVLPGYDFVRNFPQGDVDCLPHGTAEAGVIAATRISGIGFFGLAPDARILPVRVSKKAVTDDQSDPINTHKLAEGIAYAADHGADVIDVAVVSYRDDPEVRAAVAGAVRKGALVVAMVGDSHDEQRDGIGPTTSILTPYPAAYPDVIGVGAVDSEGRRVQTSQIGTYTDLVAPGADVIADAIGGQSSFDGTAIASAFVAAGAALLLAAHPSPIGHPSGIARVRAVTKRLTGTASPELSGQQSMAYGAGLVDPYRALTESPSRLGPAPMPAHTTPPSPPPNPAKEAADRARRHTNGLAVRLAVGAGLAAILLVALVLVIPRGRSRRWRAVRLPDPRAAAADEAPEFVPGEALFQEPERRE